MPRADAGAQTLVSAARAAARRHSPQSSQPGPYPDGVYFVRLAPVRDPGLVPSSIARSIGLQDPRDRPLVEHLASYLRDRKLLIVLDNFEHLLPAASVVAELLSGADGLRIVVSSRAPLRVSGEQECPVPPLALPDEQAQGRLASVAACESVRLFAERAAAVAPGFAVDEHNAAAVAQIVRRLIPPISTASLSLRCGERAPGAGR